MPRVPKVDWVGIDEDIFARRIIDAVAKVQARDRCAFRDALQQIRARHDRLRGREPERFRVAPEEYWEGFRPLLRRRSFPDAQSPGLAPAASRKVTSDTTRRKGERRIVVDGVSYFWRIPRHANSSQDDLWEGVFALARRADGSEKAFRLGFPQPHPALVGSDEAAVPVLPSDIARAIREQARTKQG